MPIKSSYSKKSLILTILSLVVLVLADPPVSSVPLFLLCCLCFLGPDYSRTVSTFVEFDGLPDTISRWTVSLSSGFHLIEDSLNQQAVTAISMFYLRTRLDKSPRKAFDL